MAMTAFGNRNTFALTDTSLGLDAGNKIITNILIANSNSSDVTVTIKINSKYVIAGATLAGNSSMSLDCRQYVPSAHSVTGSASTTGVDWHISGTVVA